jgi:hypothetical protein
LCRVLNLLEAAKKKASPLVPAGAVLVRKDMGAYGPSAECSFANAYRQAKRGGRFVATVADLPYPSVYVSLSVQSFSPLHSAAKCYFCQ